MNPQETWDQLLAAFAAGDWDQMEEAAGTLLAWLETNGLPPRVTDRPNLGPEWQRALARAGCNFALDMVHARWSCAT